MSSEHDSLESATVVAAPSFDELIARREGRDDGSTAVDARSYDEQAAERASKDPSHDPIAYAQTAAGPSYDERRAAAGLPPLGDEPEHEVPKTMILSPEDWAPPSAPLPGAGMHQQTAADPFAPQAGRQDLFAPGSAPAPHVPAQAKKRSNMKLFLIAAGAAVLIGGTCLGAALVFWLMRG